MKDEKQGCNMAESWCSGDQLSCGILYPLEFHCLRRRRSKPSV